LVGTANVSICNDRERIDADAKEDDSMNRPSTRLLAVAAIGVASLTGCNDDAPRDATAAASAAPTTVAATAASTPRWLFVVDASGGGVANGTITLRDIDPHTVSFSDRPRREVRRLATADLVAGWAELGFADDPPNASLTFGQDGVEHVHTVTLAAPTLDGDDVTFGYTPLEGVAPLAAGEPTTALPAEFGPASLFIDASSPPAQTGTMTMAAITQAQYDDAVALAKRRATAPCVEQDGSTVCTVVGLDDGLTWNAVAEVPPGGAEAVSEMTADLGPGQPETVASTQPTTVDSRWISLTWDAPGIPPQGIGVELTATLQTSGPPITAQCFARPSPGLYYYCLPPSG
jgi:hypothetical protein